MIDPKSAERVLLFFTVAGPLVGLILGALFGAHQRQARGTIIAGVGLGAFSTIVYAMWRLYGALTGLLSLDSTAGLISQLVIFAALGALLGTVVLRVSTYLRRLAG